MKILIPQDGSLHSERALPWGRALAAWLDAELVLFAAADSGSFEPPTPVIEEQEELLRENLRIKQEALQAEGLRVTVRLDRGPAAERILATAEDLQVDLIAMVARSRSKLKRLLLGGVADKIMRHSPCPVFFTPRGVLKTPAVERILLPLDGSRGSERAARPALALARKTGAEICLLRAVAQSEQVDPFERWANSILGEHEQGAEEYLERLAQTLREQGLSVRWVVQKGEAAEAILKFAHSPTDLVVLCSHSRSWTSQVFFGSTADRVVRQVNCSTLLIRGSGELLRHP